MNKDKLFLETIIKSGEIEKEKVYEVVQECGIELPSRTAKDKMIKAIAEKGCIEKLYECFGDKTTIPFWSVADYYSISSKKVQELFAIGFFKEEAIKKEFFSRADKNYFKADTYPLSILDYDKEAMEEAHSRAFGKGYELRVETKNTDEAEEITRLLKKIFVMEKEPNTFSERNEGKYTYYRVSPINGTVEQENRLLSEIEELKNKLIENDNMWRKRLDRLNRQKEILMKSTKEKGI